MHQFDQDLPVRQGVFEFARVDMWDQIPAAVQEECLRLLTLQLKRSIEAEQQEVDDE